MAAEIQGIAEAAEKSAKRGRRRIRFHRTEGAENTNRGGRVFQLVCRARPAVAHRMICGMFSYHVMADGEKNPSMTCHCDPAEKRGKQSPVWGIAGGTGILPVIQNRQAGRLSHHSLLAMTERHPASLCGCEATEKSAKCALPGL
jgi:hypothetical protein